MCRPALNLRSSWHHGGGRFQLCAIASLRVLHEYGASRFWSVPALSPLLPVGCLVNTRCEVCLSQQATNQHSSFLFCFKSSSVHWSCLLLPCIFPEAFDLRDAAVFLCKDGSSVVTALLRCVCIWMLFSGVQFSVCPQNFTKWRACLNSLTVPHTVFTSQPR